MSDPHATERIVAGLPAVSVNGANPDAVDSWPKMAPAAYYGLAGDVVDTIDPHTEADPAAVLCTFLVAYGAAVGRGPHARADGAEHPARLNAVIVGATSKARKGSAHNQVERVFRAAEPEFVAERWKGGYGSGEKLVDHVKENDQRLLIVETEFARLLNVGRRDSATLSPILRDAWDGRTLESHSRSGGDVVARGAHICVVGHITVEELRARLTETELANGFANRHLFVLARRSKQLPAGGNLDQQAIADLGASVRRALDSARQVGIMHRSPPAEEYWAELYAAMDTDEPGGLLGSVIARDAAQTLRLSVTYALIDGSPYIKAEHLEAAWAVWSYCRASAAHIFGDSVGNVVADEILAAVRAAAPAGVTLTDVRDLFGRNKNAREVEVAINLLVRRGLVTVDADRSQPGRPTTWIRPA